MVKNRKFFIIKSELDKSKLNKMMDLETFLNSPTKSSRQNKANLHKYLNCTMEDRAIRYKKSKEHAEKIILAEYAEKMIIAKYTEKIIFSAIKEKIAESKVSLINKLVESLRYKYKTNLNKKFRVSNRFPHYIK